METGSRQRVLLVEDEKKILRFLKAYLESAGFEVHGETHGLSALSYAAEHRPNLVILDLRLPDIHGYEVCEELRRRYRPWEVPIMMLTAMDSSLDKAHGLERGADAYMTKPFEPAALLPTISYLLSKADPIPGPDG